MLGGRTDSLTRIAILLWIAVIVGGLGIVSNYVVTSGTPAHPDFHWPEHSELNIDAGKMHLVLFAHPQCECSAASLSELEKLLPVLEGKVDVNVVIIHPLTEPLSWVQGKLYERAKALPGVRVAIDHDYAETRLFDAHTSGQTFLYDETGRLVFSGGITPGRGHEGDNLGSQTVADWARGEKRDLSLTRVFGCSLFESDDRAWKTSAVEIE